MKAVILPIILLTIVGLPVFANGQELEDLNWGDPPKSELVLTESLGLYKFYINPIDKSNTDIIVCGVDEVVYGFCGGKFCELFGKIRGKAHFDQMFFAVYKRYGHPNVDRLAKIWFMPVDILLFFDDRSETGYFFFRSNSVYAAAVREQKIHNKNEKETRYLKQTQCSHKAKHKQVRRN